VLYAQRVTSANYSSHKLFCMLAQLQRWHWFFLKSSSPSLNHYLLSPFLSKWGGLLIQSKLRTLHGNTEFMMSAYEPDQLSVSEPLMLKSARGKESLPKTWKGNCWVGNSPCWSSCSSQCQGLCAKKYLALWECLEC